MRKPSLSKTENPAFLISAIYLAASVLWIVVTDRYATLIDRTGLVHTYKGLFFVAITTALLYYLIDRYVRVARANERRLQALSNRNVMGIIYVDGEGQIFEANEEYLKIAGHGRAELSAGLLNWRSFTPPEFASLDEAAWVQLTTEGSCRTYRKELLRPDGTRAPVLVGGTVTSKDPLEIVAFVVDVTEQELVRSEAVRLARIVENANQTIVTFSLDGTITTWNRGAEKNSGYSQAEVLGRSGRMFAPSDKPGEWDRVMTAIQLGEGAKFEVMARTKSGQMKPISLSLSPIHDAAGRLMGCSAITTDLSDMKRAQVLEAQFQQAQKLESLGRLAGGVAHDFNNLLMVITSFTQLLKEEPNLTPQQHQHAEEILTAADRAAGLTRQLLAFSRKQAMEPEPLDINTVITETARMLERMIGEDVKLKLRLGEELWLVEADASQLTQVLMNLCVNARDAMPNGGIVTLATRNVTIIPESARVGLPAGDWVCLKVIDTGSGMNEVTKAKLFEPFFTTKEQGRGTGLGLSMVYGVVRQSNGHIEVETALSEGTTFSIYLPRTMKGTKPKSSTMPLFLSGVETLLVVEDENSLRGSITRYLERRGYRVLSASNGPEAVHLVHSQRPRLDLLITDLGMPEMSGRELFEKLKTELGDVSVIFISGYADKLETSLPQDCMVLHKPFALDELGKSVRDCLDRAKAGKEKES